MYSPFQGKSYRISDSIPPNTNLFVNNIKKNINVHPNKRKWDKKILAICTLLFLLSFTGYIFLRKNILLPSVSSIYRYLNTDFDLIDSENIISIEKLDIILENYRKTNNIDDNEKIPGFIAVDAVALNKHVKITEDGNITGLTKKIQLKKEEIENLKVQVENKENLLRELKN